MSTFAKIMVVVNFALAIAFLAAAGTLHGAAESWQGRYGQLETNLNQRINALEGQVKARAADVDRLQSEARSLEGRAQAAEAQQKLLADSNNNLSRQNQTQADQITQLTAANASSSDAVKVASARNEQVSTDLDRANADKKAAQDQNATLQENLARETQRAETAEKSVAAAEMTNTDITEKLDAAMTELEARRKLGGLLPGVTAITKPVRGVVQAASARDDVYVISVGSKDEVKAGYEFVVSRGDRYISTIVIDKVFPDHAAGHTKPGMRKADVQAGDSVATATGL